MKLRIIFILSVISFTFLIKVIPGYASEKDNEGAFEIHLKKIGYTSLTNAVRTFEKSKKVSVRLPIMMPEKTFTHQFARFNDLPGEVNDELEVVYLNENNGVNHFKIDIKPVKYKQEILDNSNAEKILIRDQNAAMFSKNLIEHFHVVAFELEGLQYIVSMDKRAGLSKEKLMEIIDSFE